MKKIYKQPVTEVVKINAQQIICTSDPDLSEEVYGDGELIL